MSGIDDIDGTVLVDADAVGAEQAAFWFFDAAAQNAGQRAGARIVKTNTFILVVGNNHVVIEIDGEMLGRVELSF